MKKENENESMPASRMKLPELKELAVSLKLFTVEEVADMKKSDILFAVDEWEAKRIADQNAPGLKRTSKDEDTNDTLNNPAVETYKGKKVIKRTPIEVNGKNYVDILVESGETYRELTQ